MKLVPSIPSNEFTLTAIIIGYILIDKATPAEQNSLGNWFMLIGQVLCTNSAQQQVLNNRKGTSNASNQHVINDTFSNDNQTNYNTKDQINMLQKVIDAMQQEINNLKANKNY